jgi:hypothetical protein
MPSIIARRRGRSFLTDDEFVAEGPLVPLSTAVLSGRLLVPWPDAPGGETELVEEISIPDFATADLHSIIARVEELIDLPAGWDSYGAGRVRPDAALHAIKVYSLLVREAFPAPHLVPTVSGGVQLEWHLPGMDLEIEVLGRGRLQVFLEDEGTGQAIEESLLSLRDYDRLDRLAKELVRRAEATA